MVSHDDTESGSSTQVNSQQASIMDDSDGYQRRRSGMYRRESNMSECVLPWRVSLLCRSS